MSWTTGTQTEALAASTVIPSAFNTFTSVQYISTPTAAAYLPANFFLPSYGAGKSVLVKAYGTIGTTGTPTFQIGISANTTQGTYNSSGVLATSPLLAGSPLTLGSGLSNASWELEVLVSCVTTGSSGTFLADGKFMVTNSATTFSYVRVCSSTTGANPNTAATLSTESAYYLELFAGWGTSSSSNTVTPFQVAVLGLN
jgi:hypothetical protein